MKTNAAWILVAALLLPGGGLHAADVPAAADMRDYRSFSLPPGERPVVVRAAFDLQEVNEIHDGDETFEFTGVLTLTWRDPRNAFDPAVAGVDEKVFTGNFQFDEISPGWYPQVVLVNESGLFQTSGVVQRVKPDGTTILVQAVNAVAETGFSMYRFPLDRHRLEAIFQVLGFDRDEVVLEAAARDGAAAELAQTVPQWTITGLGVTSRLRPAAAGGAGAPASALVLGVEVERNFYYTVRLVVLPLVVIVLLSFSVFWMDRSSLSDRLNVSFIGILTAVAYQLVTSEHLPRIAYITLIHGFLSISFLTMCATVVVSLWVSVLDKRGRSATGDVIDRRCRWIFPASYFSILALQMAIALLFF